MKRAELPTALLDPRRRNNNKNWYFAEKLPELNILLVCYTNVHLEGFISWSTIHHMINDYDFVSLLQEFSFRSWES